MRGLKLSALLVVASLVTVAAPSLGLHGENDVGCDEEVQDVCGFLNEDIHRLDEDGCGKTLDGDEITSTESFCSPSYVFFCPEDTEGAVVYLGTDFVCVIGFTTSYTFSDACETPGVAVGAVGVVATVCVDTEACEDPEESGVEISVNGDDTRVCSELIPG